MESRDMTLGPEQGVGHSGEGEKKPRDYESWSIHPWHHEAFLRVFMWTWSEVFPKPLMSDGDALESPCWRMMTRWSWGMSRTAASCGLAGQNSCCPDWAETWRSLGTRMMICPESDTCMTKVNTFQVEFQGTASGQEHHGGELLTGGSGRCFQF